MTPLLLVLGLVASAGIVPAPAPSGHTAPALWAGLAPGRYRIAAVYSASRPGGLWRGSRASNEVDLEVR